MSTLEYHTEITVKQVTDGKWQCPIESCTFSNGGFLSVMKTHFRSHFKHLNWVNCKYCFKSLPTVNSLKKHLASQHIVSQEKAEEGRDWEENKELLQKESQLIESASKITCAADELDLPYKCDQCSQQFVYDSLLKVHKMRDHDQGNKYKCVECSYSAATLTEIYRHATQAHIFFKRKFTNYSACTVEEKSQLDKCYQVKSDTTAQCSTAKSAPKSLFSAEEINLKKAKEIELKFKKQALTVKLNTAKVQGKTNKLLREFLYLLLDPRLVPDEDDDFAFYPAKFSQFAREATFYLGRGTSLNRPYVHERKDGEHAKCDKIEEINQAGYNLTVFPVFSGLSPVKTSAREAILIRTLGLDNLTNEKAGHLPEKISLEPDEISLLGNYWLFLAYRVFQHVGVERPFLEDDEWRSGQSSSVGDGHHKSSENNSPESSRKPSSKNASTSSSSPKRSRVE